MNLAQNANLVFFRQQEIGLTRYQVVHQGLTICLLYDYTDLA